jgi:hypothetical protein
MAYAAIIIASLALLATAWQLLELRRANAFPATIDLFREYRSDAMVAARRTLYLELGDLDPDLGISQLPGDVREAAERVGFYLDNVGVLIAHRQVSAKLVAGFLGVSSLNLWKALYPFVMHERGRRSTVYLNYFEHLAAEMEKIRIAEGVSTHLTPWVDSGQVSRRRFRQPL